ncbi:Uncharacterized protein conserved in bacteria [Streptococcus pneumoniae]|nr:Uncharacterized protein conserved in bacteria [Streptococcus pneumoniae]
MKNLTKIKFKENGEFNHFPGNTVVANLYTKQDLMEVVDIIQSRYRELPFIDITKNLNKIIKKENLS